MVGKKYFKKQIEKYNSDNKTFTTNLSRYLVTIINSDNTSCLLRISEDEFTMFKISPSNDENNLIPKVMLNLKR